MLPDVEFCGEQLFRMVELNLIDNIGEAFGFNTTNFNISDPFLSANFTGERRAQIFTSNLRTKYDLLFRRLLQLRLLSTNRVDDPADDAACFDHTRF